MHNSSCFSFQFYIKPQPTMRGCTAMHSCFSFQFYIKPQLVLPATSIVSCCFSFQFYIKPQRKRQDDAGKGVVSHSNSTSNHNLHVAAFARKDVVSHSNSTSNHNQAFLQIFWSLLFLIPILHQTTTSYEPQQHVPRLFLIPILHQTTTLSSKTTRMRSCFSFQFYIKPQPRAWQ